MGPRPHITGEAAAQARGRPKPATAALPSGPAYRSPRLCDLSPVLQRPRETATPDWTEYGGYETVIDVAHRVLGGLARTLDEFKRGDNSDVLVRRALQPRPAQPRIRSSRPQRRQK